MTEFAGACETVPEETFEVEDWDKYKLFKGSTNV